MPHRTSVSTSIERKYAESDEPLETSINLGNYNICGSCGSEDTFPIYLDSVGDYMGYEITVEIKCKRCGIYTTYWEDYDPG